MNKNIAAFIPVFLILASVPVFCDNIRGDVVKNIILSDSNIKDKNEFVMSIEDVFAVSIDKDSDFIRGFELSVKVPAVLRNYGNSFAFILYRQITPEIKSGIGTYYGKKYYSFILPETARFFIRIPYGQQLENETDPYTTVVSEIIEQDDLPVMVTVLPMMKGFPSSLYESSFSVSVTPVLRETGNLSVTAKIPDGMDSSELTIRVDGREVSDYSHELVLASGPHSLTAEIPGGKNISRNFTVSTGRTTSVNLEIEALESYADIEVPENTSVFLDGTKIETGSEGRFLIEPGEHTVVFMISDYKISKKFTVLPGKNCKISLFLDIFVEDN